MAKESVLSIAEKQSIIIDKFIFHIILQNEEEPTRRLFRRTSSFNR